MSLFYEINPLDTLFFRGSVPMEAGQNISVSLFPPPVSVFEGAVRTAVLKQKNIDLKKYAAGEDAFLNALIGEPGGKPPFEITSVMIKKNGKYYVKAPAAWYFDSENKPKDKSDFLDKKIIAAGDMNKELEALCVMSSEENVPFVRAEKSIQPLGNIWISLDFLESVENKFSDKNDFLLQSEICAFENRTGVVLDEKKHTKEGQLYSSSHIKLLDGAKLVFSLSKEAGLLEDGTILLGGESRISGYKKIEENPLKAFSFEAKRFVSLAPVEATDEILKSLVASSKLEITAGWDLAKGFHKPTSSWIPAGAVFNKNVNNICIPIKEI